MKDVIDPMLSRLDALEAKPSMAFRGVWRDGNQYQAGKRGQPRRQRQDM